MDQPCFLMIYTQTHIARLQNANFVSAFMRLQWSIHQLKVMLPSKTGSLFAACLALVLKLKR